MVKPHIGLDDWELKRPLQEQRARYEAQHAAGHDVRRNKDAELDVMIARRRAALETAIATRKQRDELILVMAHKIIDLKHRLNAAVGGALHRKAGTLNDQSFQSVPEIEADAMRFVREAFAYIDQM